MNSLLYNIEVSGASGLFSLEHTTPCLLPPVLLSVLLTIHLKMLGACPYAGIFSVKLIKPSKSHKIWESIPPW